eukprot:scaffold301626_cov20-Prasinocladus_malaysianus.AAC.3
MASFILLKDQSVLCASLLIIVAFSQQHSWAALSAFRLWHQVSTGAHQYHDVPASTAFLCSTIELDNLIASFASQHLQVLFQQSMSFDAAAGTDPWEL